MRTFTRALALAATVLVCASCTPRSVGATGIGVDADGALTGFLQVCDEHVDGVTLYTQDDDLEAASWTAPGPIGGGAQWRLDVTTAWSDSATPLLLVEGKTYATHSPPACSAVIGDPSWARSASSLIGIRR